MRLNCPDLLLVNRIEGSTFAHELLVSHDKVHCATSPLTPTSHAFIIKLIPKAHKLTSFKRYTTPKYHNRKAPASER